jgi:hypothetical protein
MMSDNCSLEVSLSAKGLANLSRNVYENDFTFIVSNDQYHCSSLITAFLSPIIAKLYTSDPILRDIVVKTSDPNHYFELFINLSFGFRLTSRLRIVTLSVQSAVNCGIKKCLIAL